MLFAYKHIDYHHGLWFQFEFQGDASRSLRAFLTAVLAIVGYALLRLLRPPRRRIPVGSQDNAEGIALKPYLHRAGDASRATRPAVQQSRSVK